MFFIKYKTKQIFKYVYNNQTSKYILNTKYVAKKMVPKYYSNNINFSTIEN